MKPHGISPLAKVQGAKGMQGHGGRAWAIFSIIRLNQSD